MRADGFPARLFGRDPRALTLPRPVRVLRAVMSAKPHGGLRGDDRRIRCGALFVEDPQPILALCRALRDAGAPDCAVQIMWADRTPAAFVLSFLQTSEIADGRFARARHPERPAA